MKDGPEPMDVDQTHGLTSFPIICRRCNKPGHYAKECPNAFDVQMMTTEEKLELINSSSKWMSHKLIMGISK